MQEVINNSSRCDRCLTQEMICMLSICMCRTPTLFASKYIKMLLRKALACEQCACAEHPYILVNLTQFNIRISKTISTLEQIKWEWLFVLVVNSHIIYQLMCARLDPAWRCARAVSSMTYTSSSLEDILGLLYHFEPCRTQLWIILWSKPINSLF